MVAPPPPPLLLLALLLAPLLLLLAGLILGVSDGTDADFEAADVVGPIAAIIGICRFTKSQLKKNRRPCRFLSIAKSVSLGSDRVSTGPIVKPGRERPEIRGGTEGKRKSVPAMVG